MTSSSGDSAAPLDFHTSTDDEESKLHAVHDCPLCCKPRRNFYCQTCIKNGDFNHSSSRCTERFVDKKLKLMCHKQDRLKTRELIESKLSPNLKMGRIEGEIELCSDRIRLLKILIQDKKKSIAEKREKVKNLTAFNEEKKARLPRYEDRVGKLKGFVKAKYVELKEKEKELIKVQDELKRVRKNNIHQLVRYKFPISIVQPSESHEDEDTVSALEEACMTAYVQGKWVFTNVSSELQHCIVAPALPSSGDYSAYNDWVAANKDGVPNPSNTVDYNPAYNISAALTYTTQLVNMIAFYLDTRLPSKLCYSEFCTNELPKDKFTKRVARLNWNVLHLCLSQNVDPRLLRPEGTLSNILQLLESEDLGRLGACDVNAEASRALEDKLRPMLEVPTDSEDSEDDSEHLSYEWEAVANVGLPEVEAGPVQSASSQQQINSSSVAGGLITSTAASIASLWRGWATNR
uniref:Beclin 1-associated autophagy-related key regulator n=1 Tax=Lygus hesperus TaxID=30085 RepID=A0A0K8SSI9_LYGHE